MRATIQHDLPKRFKADHDLAAEYVTTPPLPSSSPAPLTELMEVSPLPHKLPFSTQIEITSPTPLSTPTADDDHDDDMMLDSPAPITRQSSLEPPKSLLAESVSMSNPPVTRACILT